MKHLFNGDAAASVFLESATEDEVVVWREALPHGPAPNVDLDEWIEIRTRFIAAALSGDGDRIDLRQQEDRLRAAALSDDLLIWIEADLSCQLTLAAVAHRLAKLPHHDIHLISVASFAGRPDFRGLGELTTAELMSLSGSRRLLSAEELEAFAEAWRCYCAAEPHELAKGVKGEKFGEHLGAALAQHLRRFPSADGAAGSVERTVLGSLRQGEPRRFSSLFVAFQRELPLLGYGDSQLLVDLRRFEREGWVVLTHGVAADLAQLAVTITEKGALAAIDGAVPRSESYWLGGVQITPESSLMFHEGRCEFV